MNTLNFVKNLLQKPTERKFYARIKDDHVLDANNEPLKLRAFESEKAYLEIRMAEMFLRFSRDYWAGYVPLLVSMSEFLYQNDHRTVVFLVGNQMLKRFQEQAGQEQVEFRNTLLAGPVPYKGGDVSLFVGLYRNKISDVSKPFWEFVETASGAFSLAQLSLYVDAAERIQDGLAKLLGISKDIEFLMAREDVFTPASSKSASDSAQSSTAEPPTAQTSNLCEGYLAYFNCPEDACKREDLWVRDGLLFKGTDSSRLERIVQHDYCMVQLRHLTERSDYNLLPFHALWGRVQDAVYDNPPMAELLSLDLSREISRSPDITRSQRTQLITMYHANYLDELALRNPPKVNGNQPNRGEGVLGILNKTIANAKSANADLQALTTLWGISDNWEKIIGDKPRVQKAALTEEVMRSQLRTLDAIEDSDACDPDKLVDALVKASMHSPMRADGTKDS